MKHSSQQDKDVTINGFEPTYEELKPVTEENSLTFTTPGFEPTYEELKHWFFNGRNSSCKRFEPTYEELKRAIGGTGVDGSEPDLSLPMRN